jgi:hypothetical protein
MIQRLRDLRLYASPRFSRPRTWMVRPCTSKYTRKSPTRKRKLPGESSPMSLISPKPVAASFSSASTIRSECSLESFDNCLNVTRSNSSANGTSSGRTFGPFFVQFRPDIFETQCWLFRFSGRLNLGNHLWRNAALGDLGCGTQSGKKRVFYRFGFLHWDSFSEQHLERLAACTQATFESEPVKFRQGFFRDCFLQHCHGTSLAVQPSDWVNNPQFFSRGHA